MGRGDRGGQAGGTHEARRHRGASDADRGLPSHRKRGFGARVRARGFDAAARFLSLQMGRDAALQGSRGTRTHHCNTPSSRTRFLTQGVTVGALSANGMAAEHARKRCGVGGRRGGRETGHCGTSARFCIELAPRPGLEPGTCGLQRLHVGLSHHPRHGPLGCRALMGAYCSGCSPPSLCTFPPTACPSADLAQDSSTKDIP